MTQAILHSTGVAQPGTDALHPSGLCLATPSRDRHWELLRQGPGLLPHALLPVLPCKLSRVCSGPPLVNPPVGFRGPKSRCSKKRPVRKHPSVTSPLGLGRYAEVRKDLNTIASGFSVFDPWTLCRGPERPQHIACFRVFEPWPLWQGPER